MTPFEFEKIYQTYFHNVYLYLLRLCNNEHLAEELTSETFFKAMKGIDRFRNNCDINTWLITIAKNSYFSYQKRNKAVVGIDQIADIRDYKFDIESQMINKESSLEIHRIVQLLKRGHPFGTTF